MTTTEDNKDQGAAEATEIDEGVYVAVCGALVEVGVNPDDAEEDTPWFIGALAEAGYTVVKTEWEYAFGMPVDGHVHAGFQVRKDPYSKDQIADLNKTYTVPVIGVRRRKAGPWEPVPEGGEQ